MYQESECPVSDRAFRIMRRFAHSVFPERRPAGTTTNLDRQDRYSICSGWGLSVFHGFIRHIRLVEELSDLCGGFFSAVS
jgi:hypothetical protein